jgi:hypothetical protein
MGPETLVCARCGWRNEATARMCGGCGRPLRALDPAATTAVHPISPDAAFPSAPTSYATGTRTVYAPTERPPYAPPSTLTPSRWPDAGGSTTPRPASPSPRRPRGWARGLIVFLVVLLVLTGGLLGAWALVIRPAVHNAVDSSLRAALDNAVQTATANITIVPNGQYTLPAAAFDAEMRRQLPKDSHISDAHLDFTRDGVRVTYRFFGRPGSITTHLAASDGHIIARGTTVTDMLSLVESGDEMEATLNEALARLPSRYRVTGIRAANHALIVSIGG